MFPKCYYYYYYFNIILVTKYVFWSKILGVWLEAEHVDWDEELKKPHSRIIILFFYTFPSPQPHTHTHIQIYVYIYLPNPFAQAGCNARPNFKWSLTDLNSEYSFSYIGCHTNVKEPNLHYLFTHSWRENRWIHTFPKGISA